MINVCLSRSQRIKESVLLRECQPTAASKQCLEYRSPAYTTPSKRPRLDTKTLFESLFKSYPRSSIFTVIPGYAVASPTPDTACEPELPQPLTSLFASKYTSCTTPQALCLSELKASTITCTQQQADFLEVSTRQQSSSGLWFEHWIGRITASVIGKVSRCQNTSYPYSIVRSIMQYSKPPNVPSLKWECQNEATARKQYVAQHSQRHTNLQVQLCGLHISTDHPNLAASPDGIVSCDCCGEGLVEIKCPFKYKDDILTDVADGAFYLERQPTGKMKWSWRHPTTTIYKSKHSSRLAEKLTATSCAGRQPACMLSEFKLTQSWSIHYSQRYPVFSQTTSCPSCSQTQVDYFVSAESLPMVQWSYVMAPSAKMVSLSVCWTWYSASWRLVLQRVQICLLINLHCTPYCSMYYYTCIVFLLHSFNFVKTTFSYCFE